MGDAADRAQPHVDALVADAVDRARHQQRLPAIGECHACGDALPAPQLFCDDECREDFEYFAARDRINRRRR